MPVIGFGFGNPIASFFIFLIAGEIFAAFAAFIVNCFRHMRDAVNKKRRVLSVVVVSLFLVCVIAGGTAFATLFPFSKLTVDGVTYQVTETWKEYEVTAIDENLTEVTVSTTLRGLPVRQVEWKNFEQVQTLYIKGTDIKRFVSYNHMPSKIVLEEGLTEIPDSTFSESDIVEVVLPSTITKIGYGAFYNCTNLKRINLGDNLNFVDESAFKGCVSLEELYLGHSFQTSYVSSFSGLSGLKKVILNCNNVPDNETMQYSWYLLDTKTANGLEFVIGKDVEVAPYFNLFEHHGSVNEFNTVSTVTFEDGCKVRELDGTFRGFYNLTSVVLPESVKKVGKSTFEQCQSLESIDLSGVTELDTENLFTNCFSLKSVILPDNLTEIGPYMFSNCKSLVSLTIPQSVTVIGENAFSKCAIETIVLPQNLTEIGTKAFYITDLKEIFIPKSVTYIGEAAFVAFTFNQLNVYCEVDSKPEGWHDDWAHDNYYIDILWGRNKP